MFMHLDVVFFIEYYNLISIYLTSVYLLHFGFDQFSYLLKVIYRYALIIYGLMNVIVHIMDLCFIVMDCYYIYIYSDSVRVVLCTICDFIFCICNCKV